MTAVLPRTAVGVFTDRKADGRYDEAILILRTHGAYGKGSPLI